MRGGRFLAAFGRGLAFLAGLAMAAFAVAYALTFTDRYERVPASAWESGDLRQINEAAREASRPGSAEADSAYLSLLGADAARARDLASPPRLVETADRWVAAVNAYNPEAILFHETDSFGNLYLALGAWWSLLDGDSQVKALDGLGVAWRYHLSAVFGGWDSSEGFEPGIVIVDDRGEVARNLNGEIKIFRETQLNP